MAERCRRRRRRRRRGRERMGGKGSERESVLTVGSWDVGSKYSY
jgi:hypothetical protein